MGASQETPLSAQVVLSDRDAAGPVADFFSSAGLEADPLVGTSFAISGPATRFRAIFGETAWEPEGSPPAELPLSALPDDLADAVEAIAIPGPPDFGPTSH